MGGAAFISRLLRLSSLSLGTCAILADSCHKANGVEIYAADGSLLSSDILMSTIIILNFDTLFGFVVTLTTVYTQPVLALVVFGLLIMWVADLNRFFLELKGGNPEMEQGLFWKIWPWYVKFVCPVLMLAVFLG